MVESTRPLPDGTEREYGKDYRSLSVYAVVAVVFALITWYSQLFNPTAAGRSVGSLACFGGMGLSVWLAVRLLKDKPWRWQEKVVYRSVLVFPVHAAIGGGFFLWLSHLGLAGRVPINSALSLTALYIGCSLVGVFLLVRVDTHLTLTSIPTFRPRVLYGIMIGIPVFFLIAVAGFGLLYGLGPHVVGWVAVGLGMAGGVDLVGSKGKLRGGVLVGSALALSGLFLLTVPGGAFPA